jgi:hypothetical protein
MVTMSLECATCGYASPEGFDRCPGCARPRRTRPATDPRTGGPMVDAPDGDRPGPLPADPVPVPALSPTGAAPYRSLLGPAQLARTLLAVTSWTAAALATVVGAQMALRSDALVTGLPAGTAARVDEARSVLGWSVAAACVVAVAAFVGWAARAHRNLPALGVAEGRMGGLWAVLGTLVPGANLVVPKLVVDDLWRASSPSVPPFPGRAWRRRQVGDLVHRWWALWLAVPAVAALGTSALARWATDLEPALAVQLVDLVAATLLVAAASAAHGLVAVITVAQARRAEVVALETAVLEAEAGSFDPT